MPQPFSRTLRALEQERSHATWIITTILVGALIAWITWAFTATFPVHVTSSHATLVTTSPILHIQAPERRRVVTAHLATSRRVAADEILITFDDSTEQMERAHAVELGRIIDEVELPALTMQRALIGESLQGRGGLAQARQQEGRAQLGEVEAEADHALATLTRQEQLLAAGLATSSQVDEQRALATRLGRSAQRWQATLRTIRGERVEQERSLQGTLAELDRELAAITRERQQITASLKRLDYQISLYTLRAPHAGELNAARAVHPGMWVERGETLARIVPESKLELLVRCPPDGFATRIEPGMSGDLLLDAYPWMEFGKVRVQVREVSSVPSDEGMLLMKLDVIDSPEAIPLKHGLTGRVEIELETLTPAAMIARHMAGNYQRASKVVEENQ